MADKTVIVLAEVVLLFFCNQNVIYLRRGFTLSAIAFVLRKI